MFVKFKYVGSLPTDGQVINVCPSKCILTDENDKPLSRLVTRVDFSIDAALMVPRLVLHIVALGGVEIEADARFVGHPKPSVMDARVPQPGKMADDYGVPYSVVRAANSLLTDRNDVPDCEVQLIDDALLRLLVPWIRRSTAGGLISVSDGFRFIEEPTDANRDQVQS